MNPYFSVGEEVILCSKSNPQLNGNYIVETAIKTGTYSECRITGRSIRCTNGLSDYGYRLEGLLVKCEFGFEAIWDQSALRKKHKGSDKSFDEIVKSLHLTGVAS